jgi:hypothetical protein
MKKEREGLKKGEEEINFDDKVIEVKGNARKSAVLDDHVDENKGEHNIDNVGKIKNLPVF